MDAIVRGSSHDSTQVLPNELLAAIFTAGAAGDAVQRKYGVTPFPSLISSVNRRWRDIAVNLPIIWTNIFLCDGGSLDFPSLCVERSKDMLLHVFVLLGQDDDRATQIAELLASNLHRLSHFTIRYAQVHLPQDFFSCFANLPAFNLQHFDLQVADGPMSFRDALMDLEDFLGGSTPNLTSLCLQGDIMIYIIPQWDTITSLHITLVRYLPHTFWDDFGEFLSSFPNLAELVVQGNVPTPHHISDSNDFDGFLSFFPNLAELVMQGNVPTPHHISDSNDIRLDSLRSLAVDCLKVMHRPADISRFLSHLKAPSLQYLELHCVTDIGINLLASEGHRDELALYPSLETLRIIKFIPQDELSSRSIQAVFPSIRELQTDQISADYILTSTTLSADHSTSAFLSAWPQLETLTYEGSNFTWLYDIIQSRQRDRCPLSRIRIPDTRYSPDQLALLKNHVIVERLVHYDDGYIPISRLADIEDLPDMAVVWAELET